MLFDPAPIGTISPPTLKHLSPPDPFTPVDSAHQHLQNHYNTTTSANFRQFTATMHIEIQVALNFVISYLYNKLPRRRVNLFGEELERALRRKFDGHWYPEKPFKGSAYRCLRVGAPLDPVIETAAQESGVELNDIRENLPDELSVWVDPGEVSYRIGEKGVVKILYAATTAVSSSSSSSCSAAAAAAIEDTQEDTLLLDKEVTRSFNPEAQCFKPIESSSLSSLAVSPGASSSTSPFGGASSPTPSFKSTSPTSAFLPGKMLAPLTFTTATFAQTKFGSTKLKTNSKRSNRMSPTEFSNYIKQRAIMQQQSQPPGSPQPRPRSLSPNPQSEQQQHFLFGNQQPPQHSHHQHLRGLFDNGYLGDFFGNIGQGAGAKLPAGGDGSGGAVSVNDNSKSLLDGINFNLNTMPYPNQSHHQHLLVAN